jgi:hypothetical protein
MNINDVGGADGLLGGIASSLAGRSAIAASAVTEVADLVICDGKGRHQAEVEMLPQRQEKKWTINVAPMARDKIAQFQIV